MAFSLWWHYWTYQRRSTASTTTFCLVDSTYGIRNTVHSCQAGPNLFEAMIHHLTQRQCNMECLKDPFWGPFCVCYTLPTWTWSSLTTGLSRTFMLTTRSCIYTLSSGSDPTAANHHDRVRYGHRLMDEVGQAATEPCKDKVSVARNAASTSLFQRQFIHPWQHRCQTYDHRRKSWGMLNWTFQWYPTSISWFSLIFIRCDRFDRFGDHSLSTPPGS